MEKLTDIALVTQVTILGNQKAFDQLVRRYQSPVRRFLLNLTLGNEDLSDDLAQETFIKAYTHIKQFKALSSFQTWLFRIAYRLFYDQKRNEKMKYAGAIAALPLADTGSRLTPQNTSLKIDLYHALSLLKEEERTCITLQLIDGESIDHIAEITGMNQNTVKSHLKRGKENLANYLRQNGYDR